MNLQEAKYWDSNTLVEKKDYTYNYQNLQNWQNNNNRLLNLSTRIFGSLSKEYFQMQQHYLIKHKMPTKRHSKFYTRNKRRKLFNSSDNECSSLPLYWTNTYAKSLTNQMKNWAGRCKQFSISSEQLDAQSQQLWAKIKSVKLVQFNWSSTYVQRHF